MENKGARRTRRYLALENAFASRVMTSTAMSNLRSVLQNEILTWILETGDKTVESPDVFNGDEHSLRKNVDIPVYLRKNHDVFHTNRFMLDFIRVQYLKPSPCQQYLAIVVDLLGQGHYYLFVTKSGCSNPLESSLFETSHVGNVQWSQVPGVFFYTKVNDVKRACQVWCHTLGIKSQLVYEEDDSEYYIDISTTKDSRYVVINCNSKDTSEVWVIDGYQPTVQPTIVFPRQPGFEWYLEHNNGIFYAVTNFSPNGEYQLVQMHRKPDNDFGDIESLVMSQDGYILEDIDLFHEYCVLFGRYLGRITVSVLNLINREVFDINLPSHVTTVQTVSSCDVNLDTFTFNVSSPLLPVTPVSCNIKEAPFHMAIPHHFQLQGINLSTYTITQTATLSHDGLSIPLTLVYPKDLTLDGSNPCLAFVYGAYGQVLDTSFQPFYLSLLKRNWILAFCHVRGGGELGLTWYKQGQLLNKLNTFIDVESCLQFLHNSGYSRPSLTAISGTSAGGMAVGWLCNNRPHLLQAAILKAPFVDVLNTMLNRDLPLTSTEYKEWGDPSGNVTDLEYVRSYCPYVNIKTQKYPALLVFTSLNDEIVPCSGPAKFIAKMRYLNSSNCVNDWNLWLEGSGNMVLLRTDFGNKNGHLDSRDIKQQSENEAFAIAFLTQAMNLHH
jgi:oligopeptidase B